MCARRTERRRTCPSVAAMRTTDRHMPTETCTARHTNDEIFDHVKRALRELRDAIRVKVLFAIKTSGQHLLSKNMICGTCQRWHKAKGSLRSQGPGETLSRTSAHCVCGLTTYRSPRMPATKNKYTAPDDCNRNTVPITMTVAEGWHHPARVPEASLGAPAAGASNCDCAGAAGHRHFHPSQLCVPRYTVASGPAHNRYGTCKLFLITFPFVI